MVKPWENSSGLTDPTAYTATKRVSEEEQRVSDLQIYEKPKELSDFSSGSSVFEFKKNGGMADDGK